MSQKPPLISVLIPTRNRAAIVPETINSVLEQSWSDFELVISNNHSKDNTAEVLANYARRDSRIQVISPTEDLPISDHWNWAWKHLRGAYTVLLSDDDIWETDFLKTVVDVIQSHPDADVISTGYTNWCPSNPQKNKPPDATLAAYNGFLSDPIVSVLRQYLIKLECSLIRREAFLEVGGYGPTLVGDMELWTKAALAGKKFYYIGASHLKYRIHEGQTTDHHIFMHLAQMMEQMLVRPNLSWQQQLQLRRVTGKFWANAAYIHRTCPVENPTPFAFYMNGINACPWHPANWIGIAQMSFRRTAAS